MVAAVGGSGVDCGVVLQHTQGGLLLEQGGVMQQQQQQQDSCLEQEEQDCSHQEQEDLSDGPGELLQLPRVLQQVPEEDSRAVLSMQASMEQLGGQQQQQLAKQAEEVATVQTVTESGGDAAEGAEQQLLQVRYTHTDCPVCAELWQGCLGFFKCQTLIVNT
jgi:uncharacterized protein with von Willebrand factor type A (vWA) domain